MSTVDTDVVCQAFTMMHFMRLGPKISGVELAFVRREYRLSYTLERICVMECNSPGLSFDLFCFF